MHLTWPVIFISLSFLLGFAWRIFDQWRDRRAAEKLGREVREIASQRHQEKRAEKRKELKEKVLAEWPDQAELVFAELDRIAPQSLYSDREGLQMKVLLLSEHSLEDLKCWVQMANEDFLDILWIAEPRHPPERRARILEQFRQNQKLEAGLS